MATAEHRLPDGWGVDVSCVIDDVCVVIDQGEGISRGRRIRRDSRPSLPGRRAISQSARVTAQVGSLVRTVSPAANQRARKSRECAETDQIRGLSANRPFSEVRKPQSSASRHQSGNRTTSRRASGALERASEPPSFAARDTFLTSTPRYAATSKPASRSCGARSTSSAGRWRRSPRAGARRTKRIAQRPWRARPPSLRARPRALVRARVGPRAHARLRCRRGRRRRRPPAQPLLLPLREPLRAQPRPRSWPRYRTAAR